MKSRLKPASTTKEADKGVSSSGGGSDFSHGEGRVDSVDSIQGSGDDEDYEGESRGEGSRSSVMSAGELSVSPSVDNGGGSGGGGKEKGEGAGVKLQTGFLRRSSSSSSLTTAATTKSAKTMSTTTATAKTTTATAAAAKTATPKEGGGGGGDTATGSSGVHASNQVHGYTPTFQRAKKLQPGATVKVPRNGAAADEGLQPTTPPGERQRQQPYLEEDNEGGRGCG
mmetsp:Transcript_53694/g.106517  ORF Transcript_53694/g.106517 Transcript_53694/m.106517 type:complete len:226 (+) Transcript_53694:500-1177(+)